MTSPRTPATVPTRSCRPRQRRRRTRASPARRALGPATASSRASVHASSTRRPEGPAAGRRGRARPRARCLAGAAQARRSSRSPTPHCSSPSSSMGMASSNPGLSRSETPRRLRRNARTGWRTNRSSWSRPTGLSIGRAERTAEERRGRSAAASAPPGAGQVDRVEAPRRAGEQRARREVARSKGCSGCSTTTASACRPVVRPHRAVDDVEQLADRDRRRAGQVGPLVVARVGDDQLVVAPPAGRRAGAGGPRCGRPGRRPAGRGVRSSPSRSMWRGKAPSSRPSRHTTRCGTERMGTRVQTVRCPVRKFARVGRPRSRSARVAAGRHAELGRAHRARRRPRRPPRRAGGQLRPLPRVGAVVAVSESEMREGRPPASIVRVGEVVDRARERSTNSVRRPARSMSPLSTSSSGAVPRTGAGARRPWPPRAGSGRGPTPGVGPDVRPAGTRPVLGVETPSDVASRPIPPAGEVVVAEAEPLAHRLASRQVEHLGGGHPRRRQVEDLGQDAHDGVRLRRRDRLATDLELPRRVLRPVTSGRAGEVAWMRRPNSRCRGT